MQSADRPLEVLDVGLCTQEQGLAWVVPVPESFGPGDTSGVPAVSRLSLYEDDRPLGPPRAAHDTIRRAGGGFYSHWNKALYFSTSDGSDPRTNGRRYHIGLVPEDLGNYPQEVYIETINTCNARCPFCPLFQGPSAMDRTLRPATIMSWELFEKCAREVAAWPWLPATIFPHANGEPLQDPQFARRLALLAELRLTRLVNLHTNAQFLSEEMARAILSANVRTISIAFDGATKEVYEAHRVRCDYHRVLHNIETFVRLRNEMNAHTEIEIVYVRTRQNEHEVMAAHEMFSNILDLERDRLFDKLSSDWAEHPEDTDYYMLPKTGVRRAGGCMTLEHQLVINSDGTVAACCIDYNLSVSKGGLGNAGTETLTGIWGGQKREQLRRLLEDDTASLPNKCQNCPSLFTEEKVDSNAAKIVADGAAGGSLGFIYPMTKPNSI